MATLSRQARETIKAADMSRWGGQRVTIAGYIRHQQWRADDGKWHGDKCGCPDDRCIGFHHDESEECGCLEVCLDEYIRSLDLSKAVV